jgi:hypothetical protein
VESPRSGGVELHTPSNGSDGRDIAHVVCGPAQRSPGIARTHRRPSSDASARDRRRGDQPYASCSPSSLVVAAGGASGCSWR